jgi:hypothetical protein
MMPTAVPLIGDGSAHPWQQALPLLVSTTW